MTKKQTSTNFSEELVSSWMNAAANFWENTATKERGDAKSEEPLNEGSKESKGFHGNNQFESWQTGYKNLTSFMKLMSNPKNQDSAAQSMGSIYELLTQMSGDSSENIMEFQNRVFKKLSALDMQSKPYNYDDVEHNIFDSFRSLYEDEFQKYFNIPQFGLSRFHQERLLKLIDKFNVFQSHLSELVYLFSVPLDKTNQVMQQNMMEDMINNPDKEKGKGYAEWVKTLEGHYMVLLKSEKYTKVLKNTIDSMAEYRNAKNEVLCEVLKLLPIPTNKDMDEVYKELYTVKKQLKEMSKKIDKLTKS